MCKLDIGCMKEHIEVSKTLSALEESLCHATPRSLWAHERQNCLLAGFVCWSIALILMIKKGSFSSHLSFTMQVCKKNQSANFRYLFRHVSLHREATWPRCIQAFAVPTTSPSITSQGGWQQQERAACVGLAGNTRSMRKPSPFPSQRNIFKRVAHFWACFHPSTPQHLGSIHQGGRDAGPGCHQMLHRSKAHPPWKFYGLVAF